MAETKKDDRSFNKRLMDAMAEMENPTKAKKGYNYMYETLEQVLGIIRPALLKHGLFLTQGFNWDEKAGCFVLETAVLDENGNDYMLDKRPMHQVKDAQAEGSWETYMRRYALRTAFGLTGEDDDGAATKGDKNQNRASNRNTNASSAIPANAKVTEMASDALMEKLDLKIDEFANMCGKTWDEAKEALMKSRTMNGATSYEELTKDQANSALMLMIQWIDKAESSTPELYEEDVEF